MKKKLNKKKIFKIISQIQRIRAKNNVNWMNIIRLSINNAPEQTIKIMSKINSQDKKISKLFKKISK